MAIDHSGYMGTAPDLSGSLSKNRFRVELLWGIERLLTCLDKGLDSFAVVFDYRCDIELHLDDGYEFFQIKTSKADKFGVSWVTRKNKHGISIVGRLYELDDASSDGPIRLVIVGNRPFVAANNKRYDVPGEVLFSDLKDADKCKIEKAITEHNPEASPDLKKISYLLVAIDLGNPDHSLRGHLDKTYKAVMGCEPRKQGALYEALEGLARDCACNERMQSNYEDVINNKALTKDDIDDLFSKYADRENSEQDYILSWIKTQRPLRQNSLKLAYTEIISSPYLQQNRSIVKEAASFAIGLDDNLSEDEIIASTSDYLSSSCGIEVSNNMRQIYSAMALYSIVEGAYRE